MQTLPTLYRWSRAEYERLIEFGLFEGRRVELIEGKIVEMSPKGPRHVILTHAWREAIERAFPFDRYTVRQESPLSIGAWNAPEPDVAVATGARQDYGEAHPAADRIALIIEVADSSLGYDLGDKADVYAAAGIEDYWVVDVAARGVVVLRQPRPDDVSPTRARYAERRVYRPGERITPLAVGAASIAVADVLL